VCVQLIPDLDLQALQHHAVAFHHFAHNFAHGYFSI
jgi:hypothetical protein